MWTERRKSKQVSQRNTFWKKRSWNRLKCILNWFMLCLAFGREHVFCTAFASFTRCTLFTCTSMINMYYICAQFHFSILQNIICFAISTRKLIVFNSVNKNSLCSSSSSIPFHLIFIFDSRTNNVEFFHWSMAMHFLV